jgi:hypothetical protein
MGNLASIGSLSVPLTFPSRQADFARSGVRVAFSLVMNAARDI